MIFNLLVLVAFLAVAAAQTDKQWSVLSGSAVTTLVGVGVGNSALSVGAAGQNGVGSFVQKFDGSALSQEAVQAALLLDAAATPSGVTVVSSIYPVLISNDNGQTFTKASITGTSQSVNTYGANSENIALVGGFVSSGSKVSTNGVAYSTDSGATWSVSAPIPGGDSRYGAFPTDSTWYVTSGMWGNDPTSNSTSTHRFSSRFNVDSTKLSYREKRVGDTTTGWFGNIAKTTDSGKTWTQVYTSNLQTDYYYFNAISCGSENNCIAVAEGDNANGTPLTFALTTFDGGNTWQKTNFDLVSLMGVKFVNENEAWIAGAGQSGFKVNGMFYYTTDGGKTFTLKQSLPGCIVMDLDFKDGLGVAACGSQSGAACTLAVYN